MTDSIYHVLTLAAAERRKWGWEILREGQAIYNAADDLFPEETKLLHGTDVDCFYQDKNVGPFLLALGNLIKDKEN